VRALVEKELNQKMIKQMRRELESKCRLYKEFLTEDEFYSVKCQKAKSLLEHYIKKLFKEFGPFSHVSSIKFSKSWLDIMNSTFLGIVFLRSAEGKKYIVRIKGTKCLLLEENET
jgi:deoxyribodipyrimidine photolyase-like uncharacterized protein